MEDILTYEAIPSTVRVIGHEALGAGVLRALMALSQRPHRLMLQRSDDVVVGFSLFHVDASPSSSYRVGVIDCVCVGIDFRADGFGSLLTRTVTDTLFRDHVDRVEMTLKNPLPDDDDRGVPLEGDGDMLTGAGFTLIRRNDDAPFADLSQQFGYDCALCGKHPDVCQSHLYAINRSGWAAHADMYSHHGDVLDDSTIHDFGDRHHDGDNIISGDGDRPHMRINVEDTMTDETVVATDTHVHTATVDGLRNSHDHSGDTITTSPLHRVA